MLFSLLSFLASPQSGLVVHPPVPDQLIYAGETYEIYEEPLHQCEDRFEDPRSVVVDGIETGEIIVSSHLMRGYVATFEIADNVLRVRDFKVFPDNDRLRNELVSAVDRYFPTPESRQLTCYSGVMALIVDELPNNPDIWRDNILESTVFFRIDKGRLTGKATITEEQLRPFEGDDDKAFAEFIFERGTVIELDVTESADDCSP